MATFDERYTKEAQDLFLKRHPLERLAGGVDWAPAGEDVENLVYKSVGPDAAVDLAKGMQMSDGSVVRFAL
jgi:hypothetical protein